MNKSPRRSRQNIDLVREPIRPALVRLAMPIMASAFLSTAYNLTDMAWVGTLGADAVAAVGVGGMYTWLSAGVITLARMGGQVLVGQELGAENRKKAASYARASVQLGILLGILYGLISLLFTRQLVGYFRLSNPAAITDGIRYIRIVCGLIIFFFM
ncbi:MAG: MATE family efflux transporter, partial [Clostridium sp.]|nr:MATE family efflux transporter [Clostridium sp.]